MIFPLIFITMPYLAIGDRFSGDQRIAPNFEQLGFPEQEVQAFSPDGNEILDEEPNGPIDFSNADVQPDGSLCVTKTKVYEKVEKQQVKECWHQNVTQCHETYVTEFRPNEERQCEENFWKACKISFRERPYNYTLQTCMTPLVKVCDEPHQGQSQYGYGAPRPRGNMVCKTWYESTCNTTYTEGEGGKPKPQTWCSKEPRKICAPDNCRMEPGEEVCHDKTLESTVQKPEEICDLQPQTHCRLVTNLVPHLETQQVCREIPKEVCHIKLDHPKLVQKPVKLKWCTKAKAKKPSYLPPSPSYGSYGPPTPPPVAYRPNNLHAPPLRIHAQPSIPQYRQQRPFSSRPQRSEPAPSPTTSPVYYKPAPEELRQ